MRRLLIPTLAAGLVLLGLVVGPYAGDPNAGLLEIGPRSGRSFDLFGSDDEPAAKAEPAGREAFWRSESDIPKAQPVGIPTSFADLAERVAPAVVSIQTSGTIPISQAPIFPPASRSSSAAAPSIATARPRDEAPARARASSSPTTASS